MDIQNKTSGESNEKNGHVNGHAHKTRESTVPRSARSFLHGRVVTFIIPFRTSWGEVEFRVKQARLGLNNELSDLIREEDLWDMMRGVNAARQWIRKRQRAYWWKELVAGMF